MTTPPPALGVVRTAIVECAVQRGIAEYILTTFPLDGSDEVLDQARTALQQWAQAASPHIVACVEQDLRRAAVQRAADIGDLLDMVSDTLEWGFMPLAEQTPRQESTVATTPEQVDLAKAMNRVLADMLTEDSDRPVVADRIEQVAAELVVSLRAQIHPVVDGAAL